MKGKPFTLLSVNSDESRSALEKIIAESQITWPNIYDGKAGEGPIANQWNVNSWPTIFVIDHEGIIRHRNAHGGDLEKLVEELVAKAVTKRG